MFKKTIWLILFVFTSACAANQPDEVAQTVTLPPSAEPVALPSSPPTLTFTPTVTPTYIPTSTPTLTPSLTATPVPVERIAFTVATECGFYCYMKLLFVNSDGTGLKFQTHVEPFYDSQGFLAWSPSGRYLAFDGADTIMGCEDAPNTDCSTNNYGTFLADYSQDTILYHIEDTFANVSWSPDSQHLVLSIREEWNEGENRTVANLYVLDVNSGRLKQITSGPSNDLYPSWSPDGEWIAFVRFAPPVAGCHSFPSTSSDDEKCNQASLYMIRPDGSDLQLLHESIFIYEIIDWIQVVNNAPAWSPDSKWLAFLTRNEKGLPNHSNITIVNVETGEWQLVGVGSRTTISPVWSPDGKKLAFASNREREFDIYLFDMDENSIVNLTQTDVFDFSPVWSLSSTYIAYIHWGDLVIMNADGTNRVIFDDEDLGGVRGIPAWQPDVQP